MVADLSNQAGNRMGIYRDRFLPYLIHLAMRRRDLAPYRQRVISGAEGQVLEIGIGSGLNLPFYAARVERVIGLEPSARLLAMARGAGRQASAAVDLLEGSAEAIPLEDASVDTVVMCWTLCSIPNALDALREMRRVLRPSGRLLFVEHGRAPDPGVRWWQDRLTPVWKRVAGGCHLNREIGGLIEGAGFRIERLDTGYMYGPNPLAFMYEGSAGIR
jgi:ubiquinone/menaquinone biosynthesis C-methylase UbiE